MKIKRIFKLLLLFIKFKFVRDMMYRLNFWLPFFIDVSVFVIQLSVFNVIFLQVDDINGWNRYQMMFFVGTFMLIDGLFMTLYFFGIIEIPYKIRTGNLDLYLVKPVNPLFRLVFEKINPGSFFISIPGIIMLSYAVSNLEISPGFFKIAGFILLMSMMLLLMFDLMLLIRSAAFWFVKIDALQDFENELISFSFRIPGIVFSGIWKIVFYLIVPYGLIATIPTKFFTDILSGKELIMTISVCIVFTFITLSVWKLGLKRYSSASS